MKRKVIYGCVMSLFILTVILSTNAFATATVESAKWYTGTTEGGVTELSGTQAVTAEIGETPELGLKHTFHWTILGTTVHLTVTVLGCQGCEIEIVGFPPRPKITGKFKWASVKVDAPSTCKVKNEEILSNELVGESDYMEGTKSLIKFVPKEGEALATITLEKGSGACPIAGSYVLKGSMFGELVNNTGVFKTSQTLKFSPTINAAAGGSLKVGSEPVEYTGASIFKAEGKFFGLK